MSEKLLKYARERQSRRWLLGFGQEYVPPGLVCGLRERRARDLGFNRHTWMECEEHVLTVGKAQLAVAKINSSMRNECL